MLNCTRTLSYEIPWGPGHKDTAALRALTESVRPAPRAGRPHMHRRWSVLCSPHVLPTDVSPSHLSLHLTRESPCLPLTRDSWAHPGSPAGPLSLSGDEHSHQRQKPLLNWHAPGTRQLLCTSRAPLTTTTAPPSQRTGDPGMLTCYGHMTRKGQETKVH